MSCNFETLYRRNSDDTGTGDDPCFCSADRREHDLGDGVLRARVLTSGSRRDGTTTVPGRPAAGSGASADARHAKTGEWR